MFEISFGELVLIGMIALIVLGPERLPTVARTLGALIGRMQRFVSGVKADMHAQAAATGLTGLQEDLRNAAEDLRSQVQGQVDEVNEALRAQEGELKALAAEAAQPVADAHAEVGAALGEAVHDASAVPVAPAADVDPQALIDAAHRDDDAPGAPPRDENQLDLFEPAASAAATPSPEPSPRP